MEPVQTLYSIHDSKAETYSPPFHAPNDDTAVRYFTSTCSDPNSPFAQFPEDFTLFQVGTYDCGTGEVTGIYPRPVRRATECVRPRNVGPQLLDLAAAREMQLADGQGAVENKEQN